MGRSYHARRMVIHAGLILLVGGRVAGAAGRPQKAAREFV